MKRLMKLTLIAASVATAFAAQAASIGSAKLELKGSVAMNCTIAVEPTAKANSLDIKDGEVGTTVGTVTEDCNSVTGYAVTITSANSGQLRTNPNDATAPLAAYKVAYSDATGDISSELKTTRKEATFNSVNKLVVDIAANAQAIAGSYADTVTLQIAAK
jgi:spore coat protein U-like protein